MRRKPLIIGRDPVITLALVRALARRLPPPAQGNETHLMKATINRKTYNTETATLIGEESHSYPSDFSYWVESLYKTAKGTHFLHGVGGPCSRYSAPVGNDARGSGSAIFPMTEDEALEWCEKHGLEDTIERHFKHLVEEA